MIPSNIPQRHWQPTGQRLRLQNTALLSSLSWQATVAQAMRLSQNGESNITAAHEAVDLWESLLANEDWLPKSNSAIQTLCQTLYGTSLVRIGRDSKAIDVFARALHQYDDSPQLDPNIRRSAILGRAACFQRLLRYHEALEEYQTIGVPAGTWGAVVCALRLGDADRAKGILAKDKYNEDPRLVQASEILQFLDAGRAEAPLPKSPLGSWLCDTNKQLPSLTNMLESNVGPFDDPLLIHLDDKIRLHELLTSTGTNETECFWPTGFVLPEQLSEFQARQFDPLSRWIVKSRSGYGSHGNTIVTAGDVANERDIPTSSLNGDSVHVQKVVTPPLLLKERVFSLRIYVTYFIQDGAYYISQHGLVKLAALPYVESTDFGSGDEDKDPRRIMTNSGRESEAVQMEWQTFLDIYCRADQRKDLQHKIIRAVDVVIGLYLQLEEVDGECMEAYRDRLARAGLPKVMGWDFLVDAANYNPWLIEVNRFPGLESRDEQDARIKQAVLREAWQIAKYRQKRSALT
eukprot:scaffold5296_cov163-Amphora_coffeaeformis.AAC.18